MDAAALRAMQAPLKERYKHDPQSALVTLRASGALDDARIACNVNDQLLALTERYCVVYQTLKCGPLVEARMKRA